MLPPREDSPCLGVSETVIIPILTGNEPITRHTSRPQDVDEGEESKIEAALVCNNPRDETAVEEESNGNRGTPNLIVEKQNGEESSDNALESHGKILKGEVIEILCSLQSHKTPEPHEVDDGIVRASFVDFTIDDPIEEQTDDEDESEGEEDSNACPNPELQRIREEQVRKWLIFEEENPPQKLQHSLGGGSGTNNLESLTSTESDSLVDEEGRSWCPGGKDECEDELMMNGIQRRLASAGYIDYLSLNAQPTPPFSDPSTTLPTNFNQSHQLTCSQTSLNLSSCSSADSFILLLEPPDNDYIHDNQDPSIIVSDSTSVTPLSDEPSIQCNGPLEQELGNQIQLNPSFVVSPPSLTEDADVGLDPETVAPSAPPMEHEDNEMTDEDTESASIVTLASLCPKESQPRGDENEDGSNSSDETLSVSSCNSMIEIKLEIHNKPTLMTDKVNDELRNSPISILETDKSISFVSSYFQPENRHNEEAEGGSSNVIFREFEKLSTETLENTAPIAGHPNIDENNNLVDNVESRDSNKNGSTTTAKFNSCNDQGIPELSRSFSDGEDEKPTVLFASGDQNKNLNANGNEHNDHHEDAVVSEEEQQLMSLCIQEEHISSVAVTIAKWESMSKAQSTENLSTIPQGPAFHPPATKSSSSPCPKLQKGMLPSKSTHFAQSQTPLSQGQQTFNNNENNKDVSLVTRIVYTNSVVPSNEPVMAGKAPGWNCWGTMVKDVSNKGQEQHIGTALCTEDEIIYAQPNNHAGTTMTSITNPSAILKAYPKPVSKGEIIMWLKDGEIHRSGFLINYGQQGHHHSSMVAGANNVHTMLVNWFFGLISRQQAEKYLHGQPPGTFLVRISTRIWGYTLSYQASSQRTKHFLISAINPSVPATLTALTDTNGNCPVMPPQTGKQQRMSPFVPQGKYAFIGTNMTPYSTLVSLIRHHTHAPITKMGGEKLLNPCPGGPLVSGLESLFK